MPDVQQLPLGLEAKFNGKDLTGWKVLAHPKLAAEKQAKWKIEDGTIHHIENWLPQDDHLETIAFRYSVPMDKV